MQRGGRSGGQVEVQRKERGHVVLIKNIVLVTELTLHRHAALFCHHRINFFPPQHLQHAPYPFTAAGAGKMAVGRLKDLQCFFVKQAMQQDIARCGQ